MVPNPDRTPRLQTKAPAADAHVPGFVGAFNSIVKRLARAGIPIGPNALLTVRGRKTGEARTTPVAVVAIGGRRWVQSPFGDVNWVRNLRAVGEGTLTRGKRQEPIQAVELRADEAARFYREILGPYIRGNRLRRLMAGMLGLTEVLGDPVGAASRHPVFELKPGRVST
jgi:deazaflavin-dependent oxidoreductase (nitroreductase family)